MNKNWIILAIFFIAIVIRFLYFPENVYFGFDQARDAFESINIYKNFDLKIIGPSTSKPGLFHGPAWWYLIGPFYILSAGNPEIPAAFVLLLNAFGVFLIYKISTILFDKGVGVIASILFAFSFEQTQYAMYFGNPAPAVITLLLFYLGFSLLIFENKWYGLVLSLFSLGLSIQFQFALIYQFLVLLMYVVIYRKEFIKNLKPKTIFYSCVFFFLSISTFVAAEFIYGFTTLKILLGLEGQGESISFNLIKNFTIYFQKISLLFDHNFINFGNSISLVLLALMIFVSLKMSSKNEKGKLIFLLVWGFSSILLFFFSAPNLYYFNIGIFPGILILGSFVLSKVLLKNKYVFILLLAGILLSNTKLIIDNNPTGITNDIYVQEGMLLSREKQAIDYIYSTSLGTPIVVSASTMPLKINTTWAYLFNWYGKAKYDKIPYWAGESAAGFPGSLPAWKSQEKNYDFYSIIEPNRGVGYGLIELFLLEQQQYGKITEEKRWGDKDYNQLIIQKRD